MPSPPVSSAAVRCGGKATICYISESGGRMSGGWAREGGDSQAPYAFKCPWLVSL
jgi:hypothetical protein